MKKRFDTQVSKDYRYVIKKGVPEMPTVSSFYGITISMYYKDHEPPHIHAEYAGMVEVIDMRDGSVREGKIPKRAHKMVIEWWDIHRHELMDMWVNNQRGKKLPPLD